ncbi:MAG: hypothetical protein M0Z82_03945 [Actinomycetota bacterium]|nr:hypothetical protein [Actinomycetota bacterium]
MPVPLKSERIPRASAMSLTGSTQRIWPAFSRPGSAWWVRALLGSAGVFVLLMVWLLVFVWTVGGLICFGPLFFLSRARSRGRQYARVQAQRHRELVEALSSRPPTPDA